MTPQFFSIKLKLLNLAHKGLWHGTAAYFSTLNFYQFPTFHPNVCNTKLSTVLTNIMLVYTNMHAFCNKLSSLSPRFSLSFKTLVPFL